MKRRSWPLVLTVKKCLTWCGFEFDGPIFFYEVEIASIDFGAFSV